MRVWFVEEMEPANKFHIDDIPHIPRLGEFVDGELAGGWVTHVQYNFWNNGVYTVVTLSANKP